VKLKPKGWLGTQARLTNPDFKDSADAGPPEMQQKLQSATHFSSLSLEKWNRTENKAEKLTKIKKKREERKKKLNNSGKKPHS